MLPAPAAAFGAAAGAAGAAALGAATGAAAGAPAPFSSTVTSYTFPFNCDCIVFHLIILLINSICLIFFS